MIGVSIWDLLSPANRRCELHHPNTANCIWQLPKRKRNDAMYLNITGMTCDSCDTCQGRHRRKCRACCRRSCPTKGSAQLATDPGTSPERPAAAVARPRLQRPPADAHPLQRGADCLAKALGWLGGGDKAGGDGDGLHVAVIGSGGALMAAALKAVEQGANVTR